MFELLEQRRLLSAAIDGFGNLIITGSTRRGCVNSASASGSRSVIGQAYGRSGDRDGSPPRNDYLGGSARRKGEMCSRTP